MKFISRYKQTQTSCNSMYLEIMYLNLTPVICAVVKLNLATFPSILNFLRSWGFRFLWSLVNTVIYWTD